MKQEQVSEKEFERKLVEEDTEIKMNMNIILVTCFSRSIYEEFSKSIHNANQKSLRTQRTRNILTLNYLVNIYYF